MMNFFKKTGRCKKHVFIDYSMAETKCRFCNSILSKIFIDLGMSPLANSFLKKNEFGKEKLYPLCVFVCEKCFLVQVEEIETPKNIFSDYVYFSSYSESWLKHAKSFVEMIIPRFNLTSNSSVIEIASNDGYLLQYFKEKNIPVMGIEPAENIAQTAIGKGIPTLVKFFDTKIATDLTNNGKQADLIVGNNVLAHVPTLNDFIKSLKILLKPNGIITLEFPHLLQLMKHNQFDTIYHEHFSYFSLITLQKIFSFHGLKIFDVDELSPHGGLLRIYLTHKENNAFSTTKNIDLLIAKEKEYGLDQISTYDNFSKKAISVKSKLVEFLTNAKNNSKKVVCYGAPAKGNTLLNYCKISSDLIEYAVDKSPHKQKLFLPGTHIPIFSPDKIKETKPDYILILPWNLKDEIINQMKFIRNWGCKFVVPIPEVKIVL